MHTCILIQNNICIHAQMNIFLKVQSSSQCNFGSKNCYANKIVIMQLSFANCHHFAQFLNININCFQRITQQTRNRLNQGVSFLH